MTGKRNGASVFAVGATVVLLCLASVAGAGAVTDGPDRQEAEYSVSVSAPSSLAATDGQTLSVTVTNDGDSDLLNPVVEVPLSGSLNVSESQLDDVRTVVDGSNESRTAEINQSTITGGDALYVFGREVPAGESRTYYFTATLTAAGQTDVTAEVRPLYNEDLAVAATETFEVDGFGDLTATVERPDGTTVSGAEIAVASETYSESTGTLTLREGEYTVSVDGVDGITASETTVSVSPQENERVTFVVRDDLAEPGVIVGNASATVVPPSVGQTEMAAAATSAKEVETSFVVSTDGGTVRIAQAVPDSIAPVDSVTVSTDTGTASVERDNGTAVVQLSASDDAEVTVTYEGYRLGDADGDGSVTTADASVIATNLSQGDAAEISQYGDVNNDGDVTAVDAMLVAQYVDGNRDATYGGGA